MSDETTTIETITDEQIEALRTEAGAAGDEEMVDTCDDATDHRRHLGIRRRAREICASVIREAELAPVIAAQTYRIRGRVIQRGSIVQTLWADAEGRANPTSVGGSAPWQPARLPIGPARQLLAKMQGDFPNASWELRIA